MRVALMLLIACASCTAPGARSTSDDRRAGNEGLSLSGSGGREGAIFQEAEAPAYQVDPRPQREQDLETLGRGD